MYRAKISWFLALSFMVHFVARSNKTLQAVPWPPLEIGVASVSITPFGPNPDWDGTITPSGVWGETFVDQNHNGRWEPGEPFQDDPENDQLDSSSKGKYDGVYLAGFGQNRLASGRHDDLWARAIVLTSSGLRIALVSLDLIGYYHSSDLTSQSRSLGVNEILITSTHNHEGPDTIGPWGPTALIDGKYPKYLRFVDRQIAKAIALAASSSIPAKMKLGRTDAHDSPSLRGMQTRTAGRPPQFFDEELRVMQFVGLCGTLRDKVIATLINWNTHPESMEDKNRVLTSDFPHAVREAVEHRFGGTAIYTSGDLGAVEIVGDSEADRDERTRFDGKEFRHTRAQPMVPSFARTEAIGRDVASGVFDALKKAEWSPVVKMELKKTSFHAPMDNVGYSYLFQHGVLDTHSVLQRGSRMEIDTEVYAVTLGDAEIVTAPGELFPEVFYGVEANRRRDCPAANTGRPYEPGVRDRMTKKYRFILGLCPDEFGYLVPGYDFSAPQMAAGHAVRQTEDACASKGVPSHYHETNSASSELAPAWTCVASWLLEGRFPETEACRNADRYLH
jgi:hypothetical protein